MDFVHPQSPGDGLGGQQVVPRQHDRALDAGSLKFFYDLGGIVPQVIHDRNEPHNFRSAKEGLHK